MNTLIWAATWGVLGLLIGVLTVITGGIILAGFTDTHQATRIAAWYSRLATKLVGSTVMIENGTKYDIYSTSKDGEKDADQFTVNDTTAHVTNETGLLSTLYREAFGLATPPVENTSVYVSPELAELGEHEARRIEQNTTLDETGEYVDTVELDATRPLVQLREYARVMIPESRSVWDLDETVEIFKQSQRMFGTGKTTQFMILLIAYGGAMLLTWLILTNAGGAVPTGPSIPTIGLTLEVPL